jgi:nicotinate-nucleotide pyrophosphorylase (carboxylating)
MKLDKERVLQIIKAALKEDIGKGDITTQALIDKFSSVDAVIVAKEDCVVCGLQVAEWLMASIDYSVRFKPNCEDGDLVGAGKEVAFIEGHAGSILRAERTMLNFLSLLSGISTKTKAYVDKVKPYGVKILDTRKTIPLLRYLEKYAVSVGGGTNHRLGLYDQVLIKDNHIHIASGPGAGVRGSKEKRSLKYLIEKARKQNIKGTTIEIEIESIEEFNDAITAKPDIIMLDNMRPEEIKACLEVRRLSRIKPAIEVSGGITIDTIEEYAKTKVDMISVGGLTNSIKPIDMSLDIV